MSGLFWLYELSSLLLLCSVASTAGSFSFCSQNHIYDDTIDEAIYNMQHEAELSLYNKQTALVLLFLYLSPGYEACIERSSW